MTCKLRSAVACASIACIAAASAAFGAEVDPLSLQSAPVTSMRADAGPAPRLFVELAAGRADQRYGLGSADLSRLSLDGSASWRLSPAWRATLSDRLDMLDPRAPGLPQAVNSLREAYASWRDDGLGQAMDFGRLNLRLGPAYGYNPTDFFRAGSVRTATHDDPFALRENRQGTVMWRGQRLWAGGSAMVALAPKLADEPGTSTFSADLGSTNASDRALVAWSFTASDRLSGQALAFAERGKGAQLGLSATAVVSDAVVGHAEWSHGRDHLLLSHLPTTDPQRATRSRLVAGATFTTSTRLSITLEAQYNGFAPSRTEWNQAAASDPASLGKLLTEAQRLQDNAARKAWLVYVMQRDVGAKNLDITGFIKFNEADGSSLTWLELRYHWPKVDAALQWRASHGKAGSEFAVSTQRQAMQALVAWYF